MKKKLALIHTVAGLASVFNDLIATVIGDADVFNIVDETLLRRTIREGKLSPETMRRVVDYVAFAEEEGADAVLVTCSSIGNAVDAARPFATRPLLRVDEPMARKAVDIGTRIGVLATVRSTLEPTRELIARIATERGKRIEVSGELREDAFDSLRAGDLKRHDELVRSGLRALMVHSDVIVLAQASMARVIESVSASELRTPVLSSPRLAIERIAEIVAVGSAQVT